MKMEIDKADTHQKKALEFLIWLDDNYPEEWKDTAEYTRLYNQLGVFIDYSMRNSWKED